MAIVESEKLSFPEYTKKVNRDPIQTFYQVQDNDSYSSSGYSFYVKSPGHGLLLDPEIWIKYTIRLQENAAAANAIKNNFQTRQNADNVAGVPPAADVRMAWRQGNIMARGTQNISVIINGHSLSYEPWKYIDVLNRLYVSNDQSEHEFSSSGGRFDEGNHGVITDSDNWGIGAGSIVIAVGDNVNNRNIQYYHSNLAAAANNIQLNTRNIINNDEFGLNKGFSKRHLKFADQLRRSSAPNAGRGLRYNGTNIADADHQYYLFEFFERIPCPPFKMYSNDNIEGVIPNVRDMTIRGQFCSNLLQNIFQKSTALAAATIELEFASLSGGTNCQLFLKWYTPPIVSSIPREVTLPLKKISVWSKSVNLAAPGAADAYSSTTVSDNNISLDAVPDLLMICFKYRMDSFDCNMPSDYMCEIIDLRLNLEGASGKVNSIQTIQLYQNWKKMLKHQDAKIIDYDEWRRYCCVACLQPEDYGVLKGPGYDNPVTLGVTFTARNWHNNPGYDNTGAATNELFAGTLFELIVISVYDKWSLTIRDSGGADSSLTRIASPIGAATSSIGLSQLQPDMGLRGLI